MDERTAWRLAREDAEHLSGLAAQHPRTSVVLVDGSNLSPAWRALPGGAQVHEHGDDTGDAAQAYNDELDRLTDDIGYWAEGCFWSDGLVLGTWRNDA